LVATEVGDTKTTGVGIGVQAVVPTISKILAKTANFPASMISPQDEIVVGIKMNTDSRLK
jgi:hypothetical protein